MPPPADGSSTRGGSKSVRGRVRSPHISGGRPAAGSQRADSLGSCATQPVCCSLGWIRQADGQTGGSPYRLVPPPRTAGAYNVVTCSAECRYPWYTCSGLCPRSTRVYLESFPWSRRPYLSPRRSANSTEPTHMSAAVYHTRDILMYSAGSMDGKENKWVGFLTTLE